MDCSQQEEESEKGIWGTPIDELSKMSLCCEKSDLKQAKDHTLLIDVVSRTFHLSKLPPAFEQVIGSRLMNADSDNNKLKLLV